MSTDMGSQEHTCYYIAASFSDANKRAISPMCESEQAAIDWLDKSWKDVRFRRGWKGGTFELVKKMTSYERQHIIPKGVK